MRKLFSFIIVCLSVGCSSAAKKEEPAQIVLLDEDVYSATCMIDGVKLIEEEFNLISVSGDIYKIKAKDGKVLGLPQSNCFLIRERRADSKESTPLPNWSKPRFVSCKINDLQFNSSAFHVIGDEKYYFKTVRIRDNTVFYYPRFNCSNYFAPEE